jgi:Fic family protein
MRSFAGERLSRLSITHGLLGTVREVGELKGKEELYRRQMPQALETLREVAVIQSTESSNRIEGVTAPPERIRALLAQKTTPRDRSEQEIAGYRDVLNAVHANHEGMDFTPNLVLQLHRDLFRYSPSPGGRWKAAPNDITERRADGTTRVRFHPVEPHLTPVAMGELHQGLNALWAEGGIDKLLLIPAYVLDFLCVHPFSDGNGRMARLLTLLLLYRADIGVGRFISLEKIVEDTKESYYEALYRSSQGWHEGQHDLLPWIEYFLGVLVAAYREFVERVDTLGAARGAKTEMVLLAIRHLPREFRMVDVERMCPTVTRDMIRVVINKLKKTGELERVGEGRGAVWRKRGNAT